MSRRARTIKPEILEDERTAHLRDDTWRLFVSMITLADDYGNLRASSGQLRGAVFWANDGKPKDVQGMLVEIQNIGLIRIYVIHGQTYAHLNGWSKHQKVDHPGKPGCPGPELAENQPKIEDSRDPRETLASVSENPRDPPETLAPDQDQEGNRKGKDQEGKGKEESPSGGLASVSEPDLVVVPDPEPEPNVREVFDHYRSHHPRAHPKPKSDGKEWRLIKARISEGYTVEDLKAAIDGYHRSPFHCGENDTGSKYLDLDLIVRDGSHVAKGIEYAEPRAGPVLGQKEKRSVRAGVSWLERHGAVADADR